MKIKIEHGIPIPQTILRAKGVIEAMRKMKIGDSFIHNGKSISNVHVYAKMAKIRIITRTIDLKGAKRCWRVA